MITKTIFLKSETCDAIRAAAPKFGMTASMTPLSPLEKALSPEGCEPVHLTDQDAETFHALRKSRKISADNLALSLVS